MLDIKYIRAIIAGIVWVYIQANNAIDDPRRDPNATTTYEYEYNFDGSKSYDVSWLFIVVIGIIVIPKLIVWYAMNNAWKNFAASNGFSLVRNSSEAFGLTHVPSFKAKLISAGLSPVKGTFENLRFSLYTRQYKEGGVLRWRERQMDTILTVTLSANLPHIVINARGNERARRSNLSQSYPREQSFTFEGVYGEKYDVYADPSTRLLAFQLFTPDVLQVLYESLPTADIELAGDKIWIVQRYGVLDEKLAVTMLQAAKSLCDELSKQIQVAGLSSDAGNSGVR